MGEMAGEFPVFDDVFVKERDMFLTYSLQNASVPVAVNEAGEPLPVKVVGVVGIFLLYNQHIEVMLKFIWI